MRTDVSPAANALVVTPHDTNALSVPTRAVYVGGAGNMKVTTIGADEVTFSGIPAGTILPIRVTHIWSTGTTATLILGLY